MRYIRACTVVITSERIVHMNILIIKIVLMSIVAGLYLLARKMYIENRLPKTGLLLTLTCIIISLGALYYVYHKENQTIATKEQKMFQEISLGKILDNKKLYKIVPESHVSLANISNAITLLPIDTKSGFIHTAESGQVSAILHKFFTGQNNIVLVELDETLLQQAGIVVRREQNKKDGEFFPHLYGKNLHIPAQSIGRIIRVSEINGEWRCTDIVEKTAQ